MASIRSVISLLMIAVVFAALSHALVLCPTYPGCCDTQSCGSLCPDCEQQSHFTMTAKLLSSRPQPCALVGNLLDLENFGSSSALGEMFDSELHCLVCFSKGEK
ncbi:hypothetical protein SK128_021202 [Halocaridina rubra]|uniref:Uncharacterized protein n=1 Tax=Halocaridina rubra TaxID=373956 RepID=A0AAN9AB71_HALRR